MKYIYILAILLFITIFAKAQIINVPDNEILRNVHTITIESEVIPAEQPNLVLNTIADQDDNKSDKKRRIYFIHGLGGAGDSWTRAADACEQKNLNVSGFSARNCVTWPRPDYNLATNNNLITAANYLRNVIVDQSLTDQLNPDIDPDKNRHFIIAHSQGGVVSRTILYEDFIFDPPSDLANKGYGGLITVCSPLQGAMILNNRDKIMYMANDACNSLIQGPTSSAEFRIILKLIGKDDLTNDACNIVSYNLFPMFFKDNMTNITDGYHVGAYNGNNYISTFNAMTTNANYSSMPKVAFYGVEPRQNVLWRTVNWFVNSPNDVANWQANDDFTLLNNTVIPLYNKYNNNYIDYKNKLANIEANKSAYYLWPMLGSLVNLSTVITSHTAAILYYNACHNNYTKSMNAWKAGVDWFGRANAQWESVIGAVSYTQSTKTYWECWCKQDPYNPKNGLKIFNGDPEDICSPCMFRGPYTQTFSTQIYKDNDGVVLAESASNLPKATWGPQKMEGVLMPDGKWYGGTSHMQARNDDALKYHLNKLFNGDYGKYFETDKKN